MPSEELSTLVSQLRREGYDARNLGGVGITIWEDGTGHFYSYQELHQHLGLVNRRNFAEIRRQRAAA